MILPTMPTCDCGNAQPGDKVYLLDMVRQRTAHHIRSLTNCYDGSGSYAGAGRGGRGDRAWRSGVLERSKGYALRSWHTSELVLHAKSPELAPASEGERQLVNEDQPYWNVGGIFLMHAFCLPCCVHGVPKLNPASGVGDEGSFAGGL